MIRPAALLAGVLLFATSATAADPPAGTWKITLRTDRGPALLLVLFTQADGKWVADLLDATAKFPQEPKFTDVTATADSLKFTVTVAGQTLMNFDGVVAKDGKKISGSMSQPGGALELTDLRPSTLKKLEDPFDIMKETLAQTDDAQTAFDAANVVLGQAAAKKMKPDDARATLDKVAKLAAGYGPRWERTAGLRLAATLADQPGFADPALAQARKVERMLTDGDDLTSRMDVVELLARTLTKAGKADEAKTYATQLAKLEARDYAEYAKANPPFAPEAFKGRKAKSDRVVLVELFSVAEFGPSAAFDLARDAVLKAYPPTDVLLLNYHVNLRQQGDPLSNADSTDRAGMYAETIGQGGFVYVCGRPGPRVTKNMTAAASKKVFDALSTAINDDLEKPAGAKLAVTATPADGKFAVKATYADAAAGEKLTLRFAVVEDRVRYPGGNGVRYHHMVVRALPGGAKGFPLKGKASEQAVTVSPDDIRGQLTKYLDDYAKDNEMPRPDRPLALKNLKVVAFLQDDATGDVLTAATAELAAKKE